MPSEPVCLPAADSVPVQVFIRGLCVAGTEFCQASQAVSFGLIRSECDHAFEALSCCLVLTSFQKLSALVHGDAGLKMIPSQSCRQEQRAQKSGSEGGLRESAGQRLTSVGSTTAKQLARAYRDGHQGNGAESGPLGDSSQCRCLTM